MKFLSRIAKGGEQGRSKVSAWGKILFPPVYPRFHSGTLGVHLGWRDALPKNSFGRHPPWYVPPDAFDGVDGKRLKPSMFLIPWVLFNRHLWLDMAVEMPDEQNRISLLVPSGEAVYEGSVSSGWYVSLMLSFDLDVTGIDVIGVNDESAPSPEGFSVLPMGVGPPSGMGFFERRRMGRLIKSLCIFGFGGLLCAGGHSLLSVDAERMMEFRDNSEYLVLLEDQVRQYSQEVERLKGLGFSVSLVDQLINASLAAGVQVEMNESGVRWMEPLGGSGSFSILADYYRYLGEGVDFPADFLSCPEEVAPGSWRNCLWVSET